MRNKLFATIIVAGVSLVTIAEVNPQAQSTLTLGDVMASKHKVPLKKKLPRQTMKHCNELDNGNLCIAKSDPSQDIKLSPEDARKIFAILLVAEASKYNK